MDENYLNDQAMKAVKGGDLLLLQTALRAGANPSYWVDYGEDGPSDAHHGSTLLHYAAIYQQWEMADVLLNAGADVNAQDCGGFTPLHIVASRSDPASMAAAQKLLDHGADPHLLTNGGRRSAIDYGSSSQLHKAVAQGNEERAMRLYNEGVEWGLCAGDDVRDVRTEQPLWRAAFDSGLDAIGLRAATNALNESGAWYDLDSNGYNPLQYAAREGRPKLCQALIDAGYPVNETEHEWDTCTTYTLASNQACRDVLLKNGASPHTRTQLHIDAAEYESEYESGSLIRSIRKQVAEGVDINAVNQWGRTPLHVARTAAAINAFLDCGADINARDPCGRTPLFDAIACGNHDVAHVLLDRGADPTICSVSGQTSLHVIDHFDYRRAKANPALAEELLGMSIDDWENANVVLAQRLIDRGCDVNKRDINGDTPMFAAAQQHSPLLAETLLAHGADPRLTNHKGQTPGELAQSRETREVIESHATALNLRDALSMSVSHQHEQARQGNGRRM